MNFTFIKNKKKYGFFKNEITLNIDLFNEGLFVFGSKDSNKKDFLINISKKIIENDIQLIYITDSDFIVENLLTFIEDKDMINIEDINKVFKNRNFEYKSKVNIIKMEQDYSFPLQKKGKQYFPSLLNNISKLNNAIVIIDEVLNQNIEIKDLRNAIKTLQNSSVGLIVSDYYVRLYDDVLNDVQHHVFFYLYDSPYELKNHPIILKNLTNINEFEKRELNYVYDLFSYYNNKSSNIQFDLKI